jgi:hypothetical protein
MLARRGFTTLPARPEKRLYGSPQAWRVASQQQQQATSGAPSCHGKTFSQPAYGKAFDRRPPNDRRARAWQPAEDMLA